MTNIEGNRQGGSGLLATRRGKKKKQKLIESPGQQNGCQLVKNSENKKNPKEGRKEITVWHEHMYRPRV